MLKNIQFIVAILLMTACVKSPDDFSGDGELRGRLFYQNTLGANSQPIPLPGKSVKVAYSPSDALNFIYSVVTDSAGYFAFTALNKKQKYDIFFDDSVNSQRYLGFSPSLQPDNDQLQLVAEPDLLHQNILQVLTKDGSGGSVGNASVCVFNSQLLFNADSCQGSIYQASSDMNGSLLLYNVELTTYFLKASTFVNGAFFYGEGTITVTGPGTTPITINMSPVNAINELDIKVTTGNGQPVPNDSICVFNNQQLFLQNTCVGSVYQLIADNNGMATLSNITPGTYYLWVKAVFGNLTLTGTGTVAVASGKSPLTVVVQ